MLNKSNVPWPVCFIAVVVLVLFKQIHLVMRANAWDLTPCWRETFGTTLQMTTLISIKCRQCRPNRLSLTVLSSCLLIKWVMSFNVGSSHQHWRGSELTWFIIGVAQINTWNQCCLHWRPLLVPLPKIEQFRWF